MTPPSSGIVAPATPAATATAHVVASAVVRPRPVHVRPCRSFFIAKSPCRCVAFVSGIPQVRCVRWRDLPWQTSANVADFFRATRRDTHGMQIVIELDRPSPPEGTVRCAGDETCVSFAGWLGLMRVLDEAVAAQGAIPTGGNGGPRQRAVDAWPGGSDRG